MKSGTSSLHPLQSTKVLDQLRERIRYFHHSIRTEEIYVYWVLSFIGFHRLRHSFPTHVSKAGYDIRSAEELLA